MALIFYGFSQIILPSLIKLKRFDFEWIQFSGNNSKVKWLIKVSQNKNFENRQKTHQMSLKDFQIISKLGQGAYSTVYKVIRLQDNQPYALKRVKIINLSTKQKQNALNQIRILASIRHMNVICYKEAFIDEATKSLCIVMQLANNKDLGFRIEEYKKRNEFMTEQMIWNLFLQIVEGLKQLHTLGIFHRDIKPANIFLNDDDVAKLGDMNVSKISQSGLCMTQTGTPYYASPQVWKDKPYDEKSDIWSLGCVLYEIITLKPPFRGQDMQGLFKKVVRGIYPRIPSQYSNDLSTMVRLLLQTNPQQRPSCQKILSLPIVIKRIKNGNYQGSEKAQLLKTIKAANNFYQMNEQLPKANYNPVKVRKARGIKSLIDSIQDRQKNEIDSILNQNSLNTGVHQVQSLPFLQRQKKISIQHGQNSQRYMLVKQKHSVGMLLQRQRKKSQVSSSRIGLQINGVNYSTGGGSLKAEQSMNSGNQKQLKLPKVQNRYNNIIGLTQKNKERQIYKQNSLRNHKIYQ